VLLLFLNPVEGAAVDAVTARIMPGDASDPGAREADVVTYIDRSLAGFMRDQQGFYREALHALDGFCEEKQGSRFADLPVADQDALLSRLDAGASGDGLDQELGHDPRAQLLVRLFAMLREHTIQGFFADPAYGGNQGEVGWRLVGFPGARFGYDEREMARGFDSREVPVTTLADLRASLEESRS
jgi:gluconate 2-dehydrogenase gamma chain